MNRYNFNINVNKAEKSQVITIKPQGSAVKYYNLNIHAFVKGILSGSSPTVMPRYRSFMVENTVENNIRFFSATNVVMNVSTGSGDKKINVDKNLLPTLFFF
jgi:hypothetical protein